MSAMQPRAYEVLAAIERDHWWYRGRRVLLRRLLRRFPPPSGARLLDVGCGTGGNLELLAESGDVVGVDPSAVAGEFCRAAWAGRFARGRVPELPVADESCDVVAALDVLEHVHNDLEALDDIHRVLRPGGRILLHVPAYSFLFGHEDWFSAHERRYRRSEIRRLLLAAGFEIEHLGYSTTLLFPGVVVAKLLKRWLIRDRVEPDVGTVPPALLNDLLTALVEGEAEICAAHELPFGASIVAVARRPPDELSESFPH